MSGHRTSLGRHSVVLRCSSHCPAFTQGSQGARSNPLLMHGPGVGLMVCRVPKTDRGVGVCWGSPWAPQAMLQHLGGGAGWVPPLRCRVRCRTSGNVLGGFPPTRGFGLSKGERQAAGTRVMGWQHPHPPVTPRTRARGHRRAPRRARCPRRTRTHAAREIQ